MVNEEVINEARKLIGAMLRTFRVRKGLTQGDVAKFIGVSVNTISKVEIGKFDFGIDIVTKMSVMYGVTIELKEGSKEKQRFLLQDGSEANTFILTDTTNKIVCKFKRGFFNETQSITILDNVPNNLPTIMRELGEWIVENHPDVL